MQSYLKQNTTSESGENKPLPSLKEENLHAPEALTWCPSNTTNLYSTNQKPQNLSLSYLAINLSKQENYERKGIEIHVSIYNADPIQLFITHMAWLV